MGARQTMIIAGVGVKGDCTAAEILTLIGQACLAHDQDVADIRMIATIPEKVSHPAINAAAARLGAAVVAPHADRLAAVAPRCLTTSERVQNRFGLPSVSEAAALAAATDAAHLLGPRLASLRATVALVRL